MCIDPPNLPVVYSICVYVYPTGKLGLCVGHVLPIYMLLLQNESRCNLMAVIGSKEAQFVDFYLIGQAMTESF
jgi:hypothetical protein